MLISCDNRGCLKTSNALYDEETKMVICQECGNSISKVSDSMKRALKSFGQIVRTHEKKSFLMACKSCNANRQVVLDQYGNTICKQCHNTMVVQKAFLTAMENTGALERVHLDDSDTEASDKPTQSSKAKKVKKIKSKRSTGKTKSNKKV